MSGKSRQALVLSVLTFGGAVVLYKVIESSKAGMTEKDYMEKFGKSREETERMKQTQLAMAARLKKGIHKLDKESEDI